MEIALKDNRLITGTVTRKGAEMLYVGEKKIPKLRFSVCLETKRDPDGKFNSRYMDCELFGRKAEIAPKISAESMVLCAGKISRPSWKGRDGEEHSKEVLDCDFVMVSGNAMQKAVQGTKFFQEMDEEDGDLPF